MSDTQVLEERLMRLQASLDESLGSASKRKSNTLVIMVIAVLGLSFYLMVAYYKIAEFDSNTVVLNMEAYTLSQIDAMAPELSQQLIAYAPQATSELESLLRNAPKELTSQLRLSIKTIVADVLPGLEADLYAYIKQALDQAATDLPKKEDGTVDQAEFKKVMDELGAAYGNEVQKLVDRIHQEYKSKATEILTAMDHLARGQGLDPSQHELRQAMIRFLQLMEKWEPDISKIKTQ